MQARCEEREQCGESQRNRDWPSLACQGDETDEAQRRGNPTGLHLRSAQPAGVSQEAEEVIGEPDQIAL